MFGSVLWGALAKEISSCVLGPALSVVYIFYGNDNVFFQTGNSIWNLVKARGLGDMFKRQLCV